METSLAPSPAAAPAAPSAPSSSPSPASTPSSTPSSPSKSGLSGQSLQERIASTLAGEPSTSAAPAVSEPPAAEVEPVASPDSIESDVEPEEEAFQFSDEKPATPAAAEPEPTPAEEEFKAPEMKEILKTERGRRMLQSFKTMRELADPTNGIGYMPSAEQIKSDMIAASDMQMMNHEFNSGDPTHAQNWVKNWFGAAENGQPTPGQSAIAQNFATHLYQANPQLFFQAAKPFAHAYMEELYARGMKMEIPEDRLAFLNAARVMEHDLTGKYRDLSADVIEKGQQISREKVLEQQLADHQRQVTQTTQQNQRQAQQQFQSHLVKSTQMSVWKDVNEAMASVKEGLGDKIYTAAATDYYGKVLSAVNQKLSTGSPAAREFAIAREQASRTKSPQDIQTAVQAFNKLARPTILALRKEYLTEAGKLIMSRSNQRHETLSAAATRNGASVGQPIAQSNGSSARKPGETHEEWMQRRVAGAMQI